MFQLRREQSASEGYGQTETSVGAIVDEALGKARSLVDVDKSVWRRPPFAAAEAMRREEEECRERYVAGIKALYNRARDIALAAIVLEAEAIHGADTAMFVRLLDSQAAALYGDGRDRGSNVHLTASIALRQKLLNAASSKDEQGTCLDNLGLVLTALGRRERGTEHLEEAVAAFRTALKERTRERVPLDWAKTQDNLGTSLSILGARENGTGSLEEAVSAYREALKERTQERVPLRGRSLSSSEGPSRCPSRGFGRHSFAWQNL